MLFPRAERPTDSPGSAVAIIILAVVFIAAVVAFYYLTS
jgi:hypothetical protein